MADGEYDVEPCIPPELQPPSSLGKFRYQNGDKDGGPLKAKQGRSGFGFQLNVGTEHRGKLVTVLCFAVTNENEGSPRLHPLIIKSEREADTNRSTFGVIEKTFNVESLTSDHRFEGVRVVVPKRMNKTYQHIIAGRKSYIDYGQIPDMEAHSGDSLKDVDFSSFRIAVLIKVYEPQELIGIPRKVSVVATTFTDPVFSEEKRPKLEIANYIPKIVHASGEDSVIILCSDLSPYLGAGVVNVEFSDNDGWEVLVPVSKIHTKNAGFKIKPPAYKLQQFHGLKRVEMRLVSGDCKSRVKQLSYSSSLNRHLLDKSTGEYKRKQKLKAFPPSPSASSEQDIDPEQAQGLVQVSTVPPHGIMCSANTVNTTYSDDSVDSTYPAGAANSTVGGVVNTSADGTFLAIAADDGNLTVDAEAVFLVNAIDSTYPNSTLENPSFPGATAMDYAPDIQPSASVTEDQEGSGVPCPYQEEEANLSRDTLYDDMDEFAHSPRPQPENALVGDSDPFMNSLWSQDMGETRELSTPTRSLTEPESWSLSEMLGRGL